MRNQSIYSSSTFTLSLKKMASTTRLQMNILLPIVNTRDLPSTYSFLKKNFPDVLLTECFNDLNLPFSKEVTATELGHLFEHILLVNICKAKVRAGFKNVVVNGRTEWNWIKDPQGVFHILIDIGKKDVNILVRALKKTIELFERLFTTMTSSREKYSFVYTHN